MVVVVVYSLIEGIRRRDKDRGDLFVFFDTFYIVHIVFGEVWL